MLEKIQKLNILQRIWVFIIGKETPNMLTQASVGIAFLIWLYLFSWHLITFLTISLMGNLDNAYEIERAFASVGSQYSNYIFGNVTGYLLVHSIVQMIIYGISLTGLILIWRQKRVGFILYIFANAGVYVATFFIMQYGYLVNETSLFDFLLLLVSTLYFALGYWLFYRKK